MILYIIFLVLLFVIFLYTSGTMKPSLSDVWKRFLDLFRTNKSESKPI